MRHYPTQTLKISPKIYYITALLQGGSLSPDLGVMKLNAAKDQAMLRGSMGVNADIKTILKDFSLHKGANSGPSD